ncbi:hypothetical protein HZS_1575 [Henneguya salminicola]|nr:hypothetical protein HZS_1575 [Henneguya salminicola]
MERKISRLIEPTPLAPFPNINGYKKTGIRLPTVVPKFYFKSDDKFETTKLAVEKTKIENICQSTPTLKPMDKEPKLNIPDNPCININVYNHILSPTKIINAPEICETQEEPKIEEANCNKTFTVESASQVLKIEKDLVISGLKADEITLLDRTVNIPSEERPHAHTARLCVNILEPHSDWIYHES